MRNIKVVLAYDGTEYCGFQKQSGTGLPTIQGRLEEALAKLAHAPVAVNGAGRTDAGVHARGQVVNFMTQGWTIPTTKIVPALNSVLPYDIAAIDAAEVPLDFHARFSAREKTYTYTINNSRLRSPFTYRYTYHIPYPLDEPGMAEAARLLVGERDFAAFQSAGGTPRSTVRTIYAAEVTREAELIRFTIRGNGFLYQMVRTIVGSLLEIGRGRRNPPTIQEIIASRDRAQAGPTAPAHGLCLEYVKY